MKEILKQFEIKRIAYEQFTNKIDFLLRSLLQEQNIKYHLIESRTKSSESFAEKIQRKHGKYIDPIKEITDISALRIIIFYIDDIAKVEKIILKNFQVDKLNSGSTIERMSENQFGYLSSHYIISLKKNRSTLPEWKPFSFFKAEVQVRTVLQHAWAAISHELEYKKTYEIPSVLKRKLFRLASLIELADEEFKISRDQHKKVVQSIAESKPILRVKVFQEINLNTVRKYIKEDRNNVKTLKKYIKSAGFGFRPIGMKDRSHRAFSDIIKVCGFLKITSVSSLDRFISNNISSALPFFQTLHSFDTDIWIETSEFTILIYLLSFLQDKQLDKYGGSDWSETIWLKTKAAIIFHQNNTK